MPSYSYLYAVVHCGIPAPVGTSLQQFFRDKGKLHIEQQRMGAEDFEASLRFVSCQKFCLKVLDMVLVRLLDFALQD